MPALQDLLGCLLNLASRGMRACVRAAFVVVAIVVAVAVVVAMPLGWYR